MPKKVDLKKLSDDLVQANKELAKDTDDKKQIASKLERHNTKLQALNKELERQTEEKKYQLQEMEDKVSTTNEKYTILKNKNTVLETANKVLEEDHHSKQKQIKECDLSLQSKKDSLDEELEKYATRRKQQIRDSILKVNEELMAVNAQLAHLNSEIESKKIELGELNQVFIDEQQALKISTGETESKLTENREKIAETKKALDDLRAEFKELEYKKNQTLVELAKTKEDHDKFLQYEASAKKILNTKDKELQNREADISQQSQFLKNRRSNLPAM